MQRAATGSTSSLCPRGGRWHAAHTQPYAPAAELLANSMYRVCPPQNTSWHWHSPDPPCAVDHTSSWCSVLAGRSLLFIGDSLSMQMFLSFLFQVADRTELPAALRHAGDDFKASKPIPLCGGTARAHFVRNDWLVDGKWNAQLHNESCHFNRALDMACRPFVDIHGGSVYGAFDTLVLNTGLHNRDLPRHAAARPQIVARTAALASWLLETTQENATVIYRTSAPGHDGCEAATAPLQTRYEPAADHRYHWDDVELHDSYRIAELRARLPAERLHFIDAATIANARADGHLVRKVYSYQSADKRDCLHYCLPGPPDAYNLVLKRVLAGLRHPRS